MLQYSAPSQTQYLYLFQYLYITKEEAVKKIWALVERFNEQKEFYKCSDYNDTLTRRDFIDPFFKALGWDLDNEQGYAESYKEVIHENRIRMHSCTSSHYSLNYMHTAIYAEPQLYPSGNCINQHILKHIITNPSCSPEKPYF